MDIDNLVISFLDLEANKGLFKRELSNKLGLLPSDIGDIWFESEYDGIMHQYIKVSIYYGLSKKELMKIDFDYIDKDGNLVFEVGDIIL